MSERLIEEVITHHDSICKLLSEENERYSNLVEQNDFNRTMSEMEIYLRKLRNIQKEMSTLTTQTRDIRKRAEYLQQLKQKKDENYAYEMERIKQMEQSLKPIKPPTSSSSPSHHQQYSTKPGALVSAAKSLLSEQSTRLSLKHTTDIDLLDDLRNYLKNRCALERDYAQSLAKLNTSYSKRSSTFLTFVSNEDDNSVSSN